MCVRSWEGIQLEQVTQTDERGIPYSTIAWLAIKTEGKKETPGVVAFVFQVTVTHDGDLLVWKQLIICLWMGSGELISYFALLVCAAFALCIKLYLSCPFSFLIVTLLFL